MQFQISAENNLNIIIYVGSNIRNREYTPTDTIIISNNNHPSFCHNKLHVPLTLSDKYLSLRLCGRIPVKRRFIKGDNPYDLAD